MSPLVSAAWLAEHLDEVRVIDFRWYLSGKRGRDEHARGHVPGAAFVDLADVTAPSGPGRHPLPSTERLQSAMRRAGVSADTHVVIYDDAGGSIAARLWWLLRAHGHEHVQVLDGGLQAWMGELATEGTVVAAGTFVATARSWPTVDLAGVRDRAPHSVLLDVRAAERYRGEIEPVDARPGHIPGAVNEPWAGNLEGERYASPAALQARYTAYAARPVIVACGSGVTACHTVLAFELAGLPRPTLYEGSYGEWAGEPSLEVESG